LILGGDQSASFAARITFLGASIISPACVDDFSTMLRRIPYFFSPKKRVDLFTILYLNSIHGIHHPEQFTPEMGKIFSPNFPSTVSKQI